MRKFIRGLVAVFALFIFIFSAWQIYSILESRHTANQHYDSYQQFVSEKDTENINDTQNIEDTKNTNKKVKNGKEKCDIDVDFKRLSAKYPDAVGWIYVKGTPINYPVVQGEDNSYYLTHFPDGFSNASGSIFADYRNTAPEKEDNYIIYGHNMKNGTMFGILNQYKNQNFYNEHPYLYYLTAEKTYKVKVVAGCDVNADSRVYNTNFGDAELSELMNEMTAKSSFSSKTKYSKGDKLITLSTCSYVFDEARYVLIGVISE